MRMANRKHGFTLVELLSTMSIITILAAAMISGLTSAQESARKMRTRQLIAKIHTQIMPRWEAFQTRKLPITVPQSIGGFPNTQPPNPYINTNRYGRAVAWYKLWALRELVRMEMPDRFSDLWFTPQSLVNAVTISGQIQYQPVVPDLKLTYLQQIAASQNAVSGQGGAGLQGIMNQLNQVNGSAECLYLVLTAGTNDQDLDAISFGPADIGDTDGDKMPEFLDAWGNPIAFLRWAPGFGLPPGPPSDLQPIYSVATNSPGAKALPPGLPVDPNNSGNLLTHFPIEIDSRVRALRYVPQYTFNDNHDAMDPLEVDPDPFTQQKVVPERGYNLIPLIFSAGPNGNLNDILNPSNADPASPTGGYGLAILPNPDVPKDSDPYAVHTSTGGQYQRGAVTDGSAFDNIHNHSIGMR